MAIKDLFLNPVNYLKEKLSLIKKAYPYWFDISQEVLVYGFFLSIITNQLFNFPLTLFGWIALGLLWHFIAVEFVHVAGNYRSALR
jgi:hypothetical protein